MIALSAHNDGRFVSAVFAAGASGYVLKESAFEELAEAIHRVASGGVSVSPQIAGTGCRPFSLVAETRAPVRWSDL